MGRTDSENEVIRKPVHDFDPHNIWEQNIRELFRIFRP